ncbi:MAG: PEGA domain-containing protein [Sandaracinus sp.]
MRNPLVRLGSSVAVLALAFLVQVAPAAAQRGIPVNIESVPPGATVYLDTPDGTPLGTTPITAARITSGAHTLIFRMPNFEEARLQITVLRRRETFRAVLRALGTIEVSAGNEGARGATVVIDGQPAGAPLGSLPVRVDSLPPGRHQIVAQHEGYVQFEQWVDVQGGQTVRVTAMLERAAPTTGSILVDADVRGAPIFLDGQSTGMATTTVIDNVPVGNHTVEIRADGLPPYTQTIIVQQGLRAEVHATIRPVSTAPTTGSIAVITEAPNAEVRINGTSLGAGVYSRDGLAPGTYVVQVIAPGFDTFEQEVTVTAGQTTSVRAHMNAPPQPVSITVMGASGATVVIDGGEAHPAPYVTSTIGAGVHAVIVHADGYDDVSFTCNNTSGTADEQDCNRQVQMSAQAVPLHVTLAHPVEGGATVTIDDQEVGQAPYEGRLTVGNHIIQVSAIGHETYRRQLVVDLGGGDVNIDADLVDSSVAASAGATTHSALPTPVGHPWVDASLGYPYLLEARLGIGIHELFDAGFAIRTFGRLTEFEGRVRFGARVIRQIALGAQARFGGGIGPSVALSRPGFMNGGSCVPFTNGTTAQQTNEQNLVPCSVANSQQQGYPVNTAFFSLEGDISLLLEPIATVTLWLGLDITSDEYPGHPRSEHVYLENGPGGLAADPVCSDRGNGMGSITPGDAGGGLLCEQQRQTMARARFGGAIEFNIDQNWGVWAVFEGILGQTAPTRRVLGGFIADAQDIQIYPRLGFTYKF